MIHYHKFLARCIKKLKRNGVDVKTSFSPVSVFLRDEVCAVSEHLGSISKFTAEEWLAVLSHFDGWASTEEQDEESLRALISKLRLKNLGEPADTESPLLRDQIDVQFLRAMEQSRKTEENSRPKQKKGHKYAAQHPYGYNDQHDHMLFKGPRQSNEYHMQNASNFMPPVSNIPVYPHSVPEHQEPMYHEVYHPPMPHYGSHYMPHHVPYQSNPYYHPDSFIPPQQQVHHQNENEFYSVGSPHGGAYEYSHGSVANHSPYCESPYWLNSLVSDQDTANVEQQYEHNSSSGDHSANPNFSAKPLLIRPPHYYNNQVSFL